jgi:carbon storage regulator CsrA
MLVLTRRDHDQVVFPTLGIKVEILRIDGRQVRLGIQAPREIPVFRPEAMQYARPLPGVAPKPTEQRKEIHQLRNKLQKSVLGLRYLQKLMETDQAEDASIMIFEILNELKSLEADLSPASKGLPRRNELSNRRALIVEDEPNENRLLASYLELNGFEVITAFDGMQAMVHLAQKDRPDIVMMDMNMPHFDGRKTVAAIRQNADYKDLRIFAVTGESHDQEQVPIGPSGVDRWFTKPVDPAELVEAAWRDLAGQALLTS